MGGDAAIAHAVEEYVAWRDAHTPGGTDAVTRFATNVRLTIAAAGVIAAVLRAAAHLDPPGQARLADHLSRDLLRVIGVTGALIADLLATTCPPAG
ncbi:hypothetical protein [Micromonospora wenchangensis]|uniref:hypothetical protein n=1 Tax=Micromonospora wenchangensis TaxID=1185415 RepID=UPI003D702BC4